MAHELQKHARFSRSFRGVYNPTRKNSKGWRGELLFGSVAVVGGWRVSCLNREAVMEHCRHSG